MAGALEQKKDREILGSRLFVECTQPVELKVRPYQKGGWIIFPLGRSVVLGPRAVTGIQLPYKLRNFANVIFRDCLVGKPVRVWPKFRSDGQFCVLLHNLSMEPVHVTPRAGILMIHEMDVVLVEETGTEIQIGNRHMERVDVHGERTELKDQRERQVQELQRQFPSVFDLSPKAMRNITPKMQALAIGVNDVEWVDGKIRYSSSSTYQTISSCEKNQVKQFAREQEERGIVSEMTADQKGFFSQSLFIPKKSGLPRWVVDFRRLNTLCWAWVSAVVPTIHLVKTVPREWTIFSVVDLENGFFNVPLKPEIRPFFCCDVFGIRLMFNRLPQGWNSSAGIFNDLVRRILADIDGVVTYIDDILIGGVDQAAHDRTMTKVMARLEEYGFHVNLSKMQYRQEEVVFLGFNLRGQSISMESFIERQRARLPRVTDRRELQVALGIVNVLRSFVPDLSAKLAPFYDALKTTGRKVNWRSVEDQFDRTWAEIMGNSLALCRESEEIAQSSYTLCTDWSGGGVGFALYLGNRLVWLGSRRNSFWKRKVSSFLGEVDAIVWALKESLWLVRGCPVTIRTDSDSGQKRLSDSASWVKEKDGRVLRLLGWLVGNFAIGTQLTFEFIPGKDNVIADQLSRWRHFKEVADQDTDSGDAIEEIHVQENLTEALWAMGHKGHYGLRKTWQRLLRHGIHVPYQQVVDQWRRCLACQAFRRRYPSDPLGHVRDPDRPGELISLDFVGPIKPPSAGNKYILMIIDHLTRWSMAVACSSCKTEVVLPVLEKWMHHRGKPRRIFSDQGTHFTSFQFADWCIKRGVERILAAPDVHKSVGLNERANQTLIGRLRRMLYGSDRSKWAHILPMAMEIINDTPHEVTGYTPDELLVADHSIWEVTKRKMAVYRDKMNERLQMKRCKREYRVGQKVWVWDHYRMKQMDRKLEPMWVGPSELIEQLSRTMWKVRATDRRVSLVHTDSLQPYVE